jgi:hypothetical protein
MGVNRVLRRSLLVITRGEEDRKVGWTNKRSMPERKTSWRYRDTAITEKKIGTWIWPIDNQPGSGAVATIRPLDPLKFINVVSNCLSIFS